jgi:integrase
LGLRRIEEGERRVDADFLVALAIALVRRGGQAVPGSGCEVPSVTVHDLRHTAASLMIASGANVKTVQSQLWHKTATMTLDQYGHLFPDDLDDVADKMDDLVAGCAQNVPTKNTRQSGNTL